ncbi:MAG: hypothetical protein ABI995_16870, partial [Acidobacteriota bacterium]
MRLLLSGWRLPASRVVDPAALHSFAQGVGVPVKYGTTVVELSANSLYIWLRDFGPAFGWTQAASLDDLQSAANATRVAVICGIPKIVTKPGHITAVVPEGAPPLTAQRSGGAIQLP